MKVLSDGGECDLTQQIIETHLTTGKRTLNQKKLLRYLVNLVCKSMTYLLENEVKIQKQANDYEALEKKIDIITQLLKDKSTNVLLPTSTRTSVLNVSEKKENDPSMNSTFALDLQSALETPSTAIENVPDHMYEQDEHFYDSNKYVYEKVKNYCDDYEPMSARKPAVHSTNVAQSVSPTSTNSDNCVSPTKSIVDCNNMSSERVTSLPMKMSNLSDAHQHFAPRITPNVPMMKTPLTSTVNSGTPGHDTAFSKMPGTSTSDWLFVTPKKFDHRMNVPAGNADAVASSSTSFATTVPSAASTPNTVNLYTEAKSSGIKTDSSSNTVTHTTVKKDVYVPVGGTVRERSTDSEGIYTHCLNISRSKLDMSDCQDDAEGFARLTYSGGDHYKQSEFSKIESECQYVDEAQFHDFDLCS